MATLSEDSLHWAISHLKKFGDTDILPNPFEYEAIDFNRDDLVKKLSKQDILQWTTHTERKCLVPKQKYGFRVATQIDPLDMVLYTAIGYEVGAEIEKSRLPIADGFAFSNRFQPNGDFRFFDKNITYAQFVEHCKDLAGKYPFVVTTDISDFYYRIYFHPLENALRSAVTTLPVHASAMLKLIKNWNQTTSYGIPVGSNPSRLLAEVILDDVDRVLVSEGVVFTRWVDDYRFFCKSSEDAYKVLANFAEILFNTQGLSLQSLKTHILLSDKFVEEVLESETKKEFNSLSESFWEIIQQLGLTDPYGIIDDEKLTPEVRKEISGLNLESILKEQLAADDIDIKIVRFLIRRMGQLQRKDVVWSLLEESEKLYPVFSDIIQYTSRIGQLLNTAEKHKVGEILLNKLSNSVVSKLEYNRMYIMSLFAGSAEWGNSSNLAGYYYTPADEWFRRSVLLALGKSHQYQWLRTRKKNIGQFSEWEKRAFIYAASSLPKDEREHWYAAIKPNMDDLTKYVINWAKSNPI